MGATDAFLRALPCSCWQSRGPREVSVRQVAAAILGRSCVRATEDASSCRLLRDHNAHLHVSVNRSYAHRLWSQQLAGISGTLVR